MDPKQAPVVTAEQVAALKKFDTCTLVDALEKFDLRLRNQGYTRPGLRQMSGPPDLVVGYAATARVRSSDPPMLGSSYVAKNDWLPEIATSPTPRIAVLQDVDAHPGVGACVGEISATIFQTLSCAAIVTNGAVRDLGAISAMNLPLFACHVSPSRSYAHIVDHSHAVEICGLLIRSGDLIAVDQHGAVILPLDLVPQLPEAAEELLERRRSFVGFCRSAGFSLERLAAEVEKLNP